MINMMEYLIKHCAPTLAHLKVANLFNYPFYTICELRKEVSELNDMLHQLNLSVDILKVGRKRALIYVYDEVWLKETLKQEGISMYLKSKGYLGESVKSDLEVLKIHLENQEFPHEIGLFLGYDYEDVIGFIQHQGQDYLYKGYWKVYHEVKQKKQLFNTYSECTKQYLKQYQAGILLKNLFDLSRTMD